MAFALADNSVSAELSLPDASAPPPPATQRVTLYEENSNGLKGKKLAGSVTWSGKMLTPQGGRASELAIAAEVEVPERELSISLTLRRNDDRTLPASHTIEIVFNRPADVLPDIANMPSILMKPGETARGVVLTGLAAKVATGFFMMGLSEVDADRRRNLQLLRQRDWIVLPFIYRDGRRSILAIEKGAGGRRVFDDVLGAWGQTGPGQR
jgi:hypothetical protein